MDFDTPTSMQMPMPPHA